jgi:hypothetical protein
MKRGNIYSLDLRRLFSAVHPKLRGKHAIAWCDGPSYGGCSRFLLADVLFAKPPTLADVRRKKLRALALTLDARAVAVYRISDDEERGLTLLGSLAGVPRLSKAQLRGAEEGEWIHVAMDFHRQWREVNDAAALARARAAEEAKERKTAEAAARRRRKGGLAGMARRTLIADWDGMVAKRRTSGVRAILTDAIAEIVDAGSDATKRTAIKGAVERINAFDRTHGSFIETGEREALLECLTDIAVAAGLGELREQLDDWRDW